MPGGLRSPPKYDSGYLTVIGTSHMADAAGVSSPDYGLAHKICGFLSPATYRNAALNGAIHSFHNRGNGAGGDGGWSHIASEMPRQEQILFHGQSTITSSPQAGVTTQAIAERGYFVAGEWVVLGAGTTSEIIQLAASYAPAVGAGSLTFRTATTKPHVSGDPVYSACRNQGYLAKDSLVLIGTGANDPPFLGPFTGGTFGTTNGASRGLLPTQHALRFTLAQMRCSVIYPCNHVSVSGTGFTNNNATSAASYPLVIGFGNPNNYFYASATVNASTRIFSTGPDFPGGTVAIFFMAGTGGQGALFTTGVTGATTLSGLTHDNRDSNVVAMNDAAPLATSGITGTVQRVTGLNAGVNTFTVTATTVGTTCFFLGWGVEAPIPPRIAVLLDGRHLAYDSYAVAGYAYGEKPLAGARTATVAAGAGTGASAVTFGSAATVGTAGTANSAALQINDSLTIGGPANIARLGSNNAAVSGTTMAFTVGTAVPVGNTVVVSVGLGSTTQTITSVVDSKGNTYTLDKEITHASTPFAGRVAIYSAPITVALTTSDTITANFSTSGAAAVLSADAFSGVVSVSRVDVAGSDKSAATTGTVALVSDSLATASGDLAFATFLFASNPTFTAGTGWVAAGTVNATLTIGMSSEYRLLGSKATEPVGASGSNSVSAGWFAVVVAYKQVLRYETRRVTAIADSTHVSVDANFVNAHTGEPLQLGFQDADFVGGGYVNVADTQGATSVPGLQAKFKSVIAEFDDYVRWVDLDPLINGGRGSPNVNSSSYGPDLLHYNDRGSGLIVTGVMSALLSWSWTLDKIASYTVPNRRTWLAVYGDAGATPATSQATVFQNSWTNYFVTNPAYPRTGFFKDMRTREVFLRGCVTGGVAGTTMFSLPAGYQSDFPLLIPCWGSEGPALIIVYADGSVQMDNMSGLATGTPTPWVLFNSVWPAATPTV